MDPVFGVFATRTQAEEAHERLSQLGLDRIVLLRPDDWQQKVHHVCTEHMERRGIGAALFGVVAGALGIAAGLELGALASASWHANPATAMELASVVVGAAAAAAGIALGRALERSLSSGLPKDEFYICVGALQQGRSVVVALSNGSSSAGAVRGVMARAGAVRMNAAADQWWPGGQTEGLLRRLSRTLLPAFRSQAPRPAASHRHGAGAD